MTWVILSIVFLLVTLWLLKGTTFYSYFGEYEHSEWNMPLWAVLLMWLFFMIPYFGVILFIFWIIWFIIWSNVKPHGRSNEYILIGLDDKNLLHKAIKKFVSLINKPIK